MEGRRRVLDRSRRPAPGPAPAIHLPEFRRRRLSNGLTVLSIPHDDLPEISARIVFPYGAADDPAEREGSALLVARGLTEGTRARSAREIAEELDHLGAIFSIEVSQDATVLSLRFLSHVLEPALDLLAEIIGQAAFPPHEVDRLKEQRLDEIASGLDEPRVVAGLRLNEAIFGDHPYAMREGGSRETVSAIEPDDLRGFHGRHYRPDTGTLILVGDLPAGSELEGRLEEAFGSWTGTGASSRALPEPVAPESRRLWAVDVSGPQSEVRVGGIGIARHDARYFAVMVMNAILGGLFSSRINLNLREDKGWTYGARSRFDARKRPGPYYVATAVDAKATGGAVREILGELDRMKAEPPSEEELGLAKNALTFSLPRVFETPPQVSRRVAQQVIYQLPDDYWERYRDRIQAVTREDVQATAERCLNTGRTAIVVVGPLAEFHDELVEIAPVELRDREGEPLVRG